MALRVSAKSSEQKSLYNLNTKILTPSKRRGLEHSSAFYMSSKGTATEDKVGSMCISFLGFKSHSVICSDEKV